jgi:hypothetical protein
MGTTRKNTDGISPLLLDVKQRNRQFLWNSVIAVVEEYVLSFAWQDNNTVLGLTTAYSLHRNEDRVVVNRRRPKPTSTNARIVLPVFGNDAVKALPIPVAINDYNHRMGFVDLANQLRATYSCHQPQ